MTSAVRFIEDQIREYEEQLEISEQRTMEFRQKNMAFLSDKSYFQKIQTSVLEMQNTKQNLLEYQDRRKKLVEKSKKYSILYSLKRARTSTGWRRAVSQQPLPCKTG